MARHRKHVQLQTFDYQVRVQYFRLYTRRLDHDILQRPKVNRLMHDFWKQGLSITDAARAMGAEAGRTEVHT